MTLSYTVPKKEITEFTKEIGARVENPTLKTGNLFFSIYYNIFIILISIWYFYFFFLLIYVAVEKATLYLDNDELPPHWDRDLLFGIEKNCLTTDSEGVDDSDV